MGAPTPILAGIGCEICAKPLRNFECGLGSMIKENVRMKVQSAWHGDLFG